MNLLVKFNRDPQTIEKSFAVEQILISKFRLSSVLISLVLFQFVTSDQDGVEVGRRRFVLERVLRLLRGILYKN